MFLIPKADYKIRAIKNKGRGVFALKQIEAGTVIGDYLGKLIRPSQEARYDKKYGLYLFFYNFKATIFPNLKAEGIHLINHSCMPNCAFFPYHGHIIYFALRTIFPGEELTVQYFLDAVTKGDKDYYLCNCNTLLCHGTMCNQNKVKDPKVMAFILARQGKFLNKMEVPYGQNLQFLKKYPKSISDHLICDLYGYSGQPPLICADKKLPTVKVLRQKIRNSGRILRFRALNFDVLGLADNLVIVKNTI